MKPTFALLLFLLAFSGTAVLHAFDLSKLTLTKNVTETVLPNGLKVIIKEERSIPLVGFSVTYKIGFRNEDTNGGSGLTHLLEHMMFKGSANYKKGEIAKTLSDAGAEFNAFTSYDKTVYWEVLPSGAFETALKIEADRMVNSLFDREEFTKEKNVVLSELTHYESSPWRKLGRLMGDAVFGNHPYSTISGKIEDMRNADRDHVYNDLYRKYYCPNNAFITVVGNIDPAEALKLISKYFSPIKANPAAPADKPNPFRFRKGKEVRTEGVASEDFGEALYDLPKWDVKDRDFTALYFLSQTGFVGNFGYDPTMDGGVGASEFSSEPDFPSETIDRDYAAKNLARFKERWFRQESLVYDSVETIMMNLIYMERKSGVNSYDRLARDFESITADDIDRVIRKYLNRGNASTGFFKAVKQDARVQPQADSGPAESFGKDIDFSDLDNPGAEQLKKAKENGEQVFKKTLKTVSEYLSDIRETKLPNGVTLIYKPYKLNQKVAVSVGIKAGNFYQVLPYQADLAWDFVFGGGPQVALKNALENRGASFGGASELNYASFSMNVPAPELDNSIELLAVALTNRSFLPLILEENKFNYILGLDDLAKNPNADAHAAREIRKMIYGKRGVGLDFFADKPGVLALSMSNVNDFYVSFYRPENTVIVVVGDVPYEQVLKKFGAALGNWRQKEAVLKPVSVPLQKPVADQTFKTTLPVMQTITLMASPSSSYENITNFIALSLANQIFGGGGLNSRLARNIRDMHGLTYGVYTYLRPYDRESIFNLYMQTAKENVAKALDLFRVELGRFKKDGPNEMEILKFKNSMLSGVIFHYENSPSIAEQLLYFKMRRGDPKGDEHFIRVLYSLKKETILNAIRDGFPENYFISIAGN